MTERSSLSPALQAAQELLYKKRAEARAERLRRGLPVDLHHQEAAESASTNQPESLTAAVLKNLPTHLGWGSEPSTQAIRAALARRENRKPDVPHSKQGHKQPASTAEAAAEPTQHRQQPTADLLHETIKVYPALATAMLREGYAPQARVYHLLRHLDDEGQGWLSLDFVREQLTAKESALRIANKKTIPTNAWRNLRGILNGGEGVFWNRDNQERLWLRSAGKIAVSLNCGRLSGYPVALPVSKLLGRIKQVKAHLYATFHTGRERDETKKGPAHRPISQATLRELTGIPETTQRRYNKIANVRVYKHYATGRKYDRDQLKEALYERWGNAFKFTDYKGKQGSAGASYIAQRLPNSYTTKTLQTSKGRQEKINRHIDLVTHVGEEGAQVEERLATGGWRVADSQLSSDQPPANSQQLPLVPPLHSPNQRGGTVQTSIGSSSQTESRLAGRNSANQR